MANQNSKVFNIDLKGELLTTLNKNDIKQFSGFNQRNCLYANDGLKRFKVSSTPYIYDDKGNYYSLENDQFKINGIPNKAVATNSPFIKKTEINLTNEGLNNVIWNVPYNSAGTDFKAIQTNTTLYIYKKIGLVWHLENSYSGVFYISSGNDALVFFKISPPVIVNVIVIYNGNIISSVITYQTDISSKNGINFAIKEDTNNIPYFLFKIVNKQNEPFIVSMDPLNFNVDNNYYYFDLENGETSGFKTLTDMQYMFFDSNNIVNVKTEIAYTTILSLNKENILETDGEGRFWISNNPGHNGCLYEYGSASFTFDTTNGIVLGTFQNKKITPFLGTYNVDNKLDYYDLVHVKHNPDTGYGYYFSDVTFTVNFFDAPTCYINTMGDKVIYKKSYRLRTANITLNNAEGTVGYPYATSNAAMNAGRTKARTIGFSGVYFTINNLLQDKSNFVSNMYINNEVYFSTSNDFKTLNFIQKSTNDFDLVFNAGQFANLSWATKIFEPWLNIDVTNTLPIWSESKQGFYYLINNKWHLVTEKQNAGYIEFILNRYILLNVKLVSGDVYNLYDTQTETWYSYASDWNNRVIIGHLSDTIAPVEITSSNYEGVTFDIEIATGENVNNTSGCISSALWAPVIINNVLPFAWGNKTYITNNNIIQRLIHLQFKENYNYFLDLYFSTTLTAVALASPPYYVATSDNITTLTLSILIGLTYPIDENGNIVFNVPLTAEFITTSFDIYYIYIGKVYYQLNVLNNEILLTYNYGTGLSNILQMFSIQGNTYIIRNNMISSCVISENIIQSVQSVISCKNLMFMGTNVNTAFFYSPANKKILGFTGNRNFEEIAEFNDIETLYKYYYAINFKTFFILSNIGCICIADEGYISIIKNNVYNNFILYGKSFGLLNSVTGQWNIFSLYEDGVIAPVKIETSFYGFGNNQVTIIDTWYVRLYADEAFNGSIKFRVTSLTNKGTESEETEFLITSDMFDKVTNSYYLRYQPKLQRGVGLSLSIESDYDIIELSCSAIADTTVQLSKPFSKQNVINGGKI